MCKYPCKDTLLLRIIQKRSVFLSILLKESGHLLNILCIFRESLYLCLSITDLNNITETYVEDIDDSTVGTYRHHGEGRRL
jgi:hypothetical protein